MTPYDRTSRALKRAASALAVATVATAPVAAQEPLGTAEAPATPHEDCVCSMASPAHRILRSFPGMNRARIGVQLGDETDVGGRQGIHVRAVIEGGPAERAGMRAGDVLLSVNDTPLGRDATHDLLALLADVAPGDTIALGYSRDGRQMTARAVTDRMRFRAFGPDVRVEALPRGARDLVGPDLRYRLRQRRGNDVQMVAMNEGLGAYFGTAEGVLVTSAGEGGSLGLRAGDVILSIGGRAVRDLEHARSIIASYRPDEIITFEIMRERRRTTVTGRRRDR